MKPLKFIRKNQLSKTDDDYHQYLDSYWRVHNMSMENHQTAQSTLLTWKAFELGNSLTDRDFARNIR